MRAVDTNVLVRLLIRDDARQAESADTYVSNGAWISHLVLAETVWVLDAVYDRTPVQIAKAVEMILNHRVLSVQEPDLVAAALEEYRRMPALGFSDCLVLETARRAGHLPLGTFDRSLGKLAGTERL